MMGDGKFEMPPVEGAGLGSEVTDYLGSLGSALAEAFTTLGQRTNDPQRITVSTGQGMRPLNEAMRETAWNPGDVKVFVGTLAKARAQIRNGWVLMDGKNGTVDAADRLFRGAPTNTDAGGKGGSGTTLGTVDVIGARSDCGDQTFYAGGTTQPKYMELLLLMRL